MNIQNELLISYKEESKFVGYDILENTTKVKNIIKDNSFVDSISDCGYIVLEENPFYAESGGQVADTGYVYTNTVAGNVTDVIKAPNGQHLIYVKLDSGTITKGMEINTKVHEEKRKNTCKNHSTVHLIQKTLQELLSDSVHQAGSKVDEESFRFDFTYQGKLSDNIILEIENKVNERVSKGFRTRTEIMSLDDAIKLGAMALFEDKYGNNVRVVTIGDSIELCGGTHVKNTREIRKVAVLGVENKGSNVYRIFGSTDKHIKNMLSLELKPYKDEITKLLEKVKKIVTEAKKLDIDLTFDFDINNELTNSYQDIINIKNDLNNLKLKVKDLEKEFITKKSNKSTSDLSVFLNGQIQINDLSVIIAITEGYEIPVLKQVVDAIGNKFNKYFVLLANVNGSSVNFVCKSNDDNINCGSIVKELALKSSGNGGGSKNFAQGGGTNITNLSVELQDIKEYLRKL